VSRYQKGKTNLDFTQARDSEWQWHQLGHMQVCTLLQTDNHASTPPLAGCPSCRPTNSHQSTAGDASHKPGGRLPLLSARPAVTLTTLKRGCYQFCCLVNRGTMAVNSLPKTVNRLRRDCYLNPGPSAPESSTLTTRLAATKQVATLI